MTSTPASPLSPVSVWKPRTVAATLAAPPDASELVVKTLAVRPDPALRGLGAWLVEDLHKRAADRGFRTVYHALMREDNDSANITARVARVVRRYRLYVRNTLP